MPRLPVFGSKELTPALKDLGFKIDTGKGKGSHALAKHPTRKPTHGQRPCITIKSDKEYGDPNFRSLIVNEIRAYGFSRSEVIDAINKHG